MSINRDINKEYKYSWCVNVGIHISLNMDICHCTAHCTQPSSYNCAGAAFPQPLHLFPFSHPLDSLLFPILWISFLFPVLWICFFSSTSGFFFFFPSSGFLIFSHPLDFFPFPHPLDFSPSGILIWAPHCPEARGKGCRTPWVVAFEQHPELQEILKTQAPNRHIYNIPSISN